MGELDEAPTPAPRPTGALRTSLNDGRYLLFGILGVGGMATVYRCWDTELHVWRAAKVLLADLRTRSSVRDRFQTESRAMAAIDHPNVARVFDVGQDHGVPFIVLEMLHGGSLENWLAEKGKMDAALALHAMIEVCNGVEAAHRSGLIHRDIKPDNLMVDRHGHCKVTDFGIAGGTVATHTRTGVAMGTVDYMAPEQRQDAKNVTKTADIYALGCTLFALVTDATPANLFVAANEPKRLDGVPDFLKPVITRATLYEPSDRYQSCSDLKQELIALLASLNAPPIDPMALVSDTSELPDPSSHPSLDPRTASTTVPPPTAYGSNTEVSAAPTMLPEEIPKEEVETSRAPGAWWWLVAASTPMIVGIGLIAIGSVLWMRPPPTPSVPPIPPAQVAPAPKVLPVAPAPFPDPVPIEPTVEPKPEPPPRPVSKPTRPRPTPVAPAPVVPTTRIKSAMVVVRDATGMQVVCGDTRANGTTSARLRNFPAGPCSIQVQWLGASYNAQVDIQSRREVHCKVVDKRLQCN